jgi:hypothetical protein
MTKAVEKSTANFSQNNLDVLRLKWVENFSKKLLTSVSICGTMSLSVREAMATPNSE